MTNTNQSASWVRMMARDASVDVDAVFFNPAGLTHLEDGFYIQVNSQTIKQSRTVTSTFPGLNTDTYTGETFVPFLPTAFAVYKKGNFAVSGGFTIIGGGGSAEFKTGLPEFQYPMVQGMSADLAPFGPTKYSADVSFKGTSAYLGFQGAVSYKINDMISVAVGARYISANNSYEGSIKNVSYNFFGGDMTNGNTFFTGLSTQLQPGIDGTAGIIGAGGGALTLDQLANAGLLDAATKGALEGALLQLGIPAENIAAMDVNTINATMAGAQAQFNGAAASLADKEVDVTQSGSSIVPFVSLDFSMMDDNLGISLKYEQKATMDITTEVIKEDVGLYTDGEEVAADMPALLTLGVRYNVGALKLQTGLHYYMDKDARYGKKNAAGEFVTNGEETTFTGSTDKSLLNGNSLEFAIGAQYDINSLFGLSAGFLYAKTDPNSVYQSALSQTLPSKTYGFGGVVHATSNLDFDLGVSYTSYDVYEKDFGSFKETYDKTALIIALGATLKL